MKVLLALVLLLGVSVQLQAKSISVNEGVESWTCDIRYNFETSSGGLISIRIVGDSPKDFSEDCRYVVRTYISDEQKIIELCAPYKSGACID